MLIALPGIGPWTADIYLLSCLGRSRCLAHRAIWRSRPRPPIFSTSRNGPDARAMLELAEAVAALAFGRRKAALGPLPQPQRAVPQAVSRA